MNARQLFATATCVALALAGCAGSAKDQLPGAVYAAKTVKVYRTAELKDMMGSDSYGDGGSHMKGQSWFFDVKASKDEMMAFYQKEFPGAERTTMEDGDVQFRIIPPGAEENEYVYVIVGDGNIRIGERCRPGKIKD